jgi:two-component system, cell cycle response regulator DivK
MMISPIAKQPATSRLLERTDRGPVVWIVEADDVYQLLVDSGCGQDTQWVPFHTERQAGQMLLVYQPDCVLIHEALAHSSTSNIFTTCAAYQVPVVVLMGQGDRQTEDRLKQHGAFACVPTRYLSAAALQAAIGTTVGKHLAWPEVSPPPLSGASSLVPYPHYQARAPDLLIVDDDVYLVDALKRRLRRRGYKIRSAPAVHRAIESVKARRPDLILLDINLPETDGWWLAEWLQTSRETAAIPVIIFTVLAAAEVEARARAYGAFACLTKPVATKALLDTIKEALSWHERP